MRLLSCVAIQVVVASAAFQQRLPAALSSSAAAAARPAVHAAANIAAAAAILPSRHAAAQMFAEPPAEPPSDDIFEELSEQLTPMQKRLRGLSPIAMGATTKTVTVLSALIAWFLTPPVGRVASLGSLLAGGYGGSRLSKTMREQRRGVVPAAIADMVKASGLAGLSPKEVAKLQEQYDVDPVEFEAQLSDIYARYLRTLLDADENTPAQIKELGQLRRGMGLRWNATEAAHVESVAAFLDGAALAPNAADELPAELTALLWLSAGLFGTSKGQASTAALEGALSLDEPSSARLVSSLSTPFYRKAVTLAVGKYNSTEAPMVLGTARKALCLSEQAAAKVHAEIYDAQLQVLLPDGQAKLDEEAIQLIGELEGILQVRSAGSRLQAVTRPLFAEGAKDVLEEAYGAVAGGAPNSAVSTWGQIAVRQTELALPTEAAQAMYTEEARRLLADKITAAAALHAEGKEATALADLATAVQYAQFLGEMMTVSGGYEELPAADLAARYLGALSFTADAEAAALGLASAARSSGPTELAEAAELVSAIFCLSDPAYADARKQYTALLDATIDGKGFDAAATSKLDALAASLSLPPALAQKLAVDAYYGWLVDAGEKGERKALEQCELVRATLRVGAAALAELHANTDVDESILTLIVDELLAEETPLSSAAEQQLAYLERQLGARPGVAGAILAAAADA